MPYIDASGRVVDKKPFSWNPIHLAKAFFWGVMALLAAFFGSCLPKSKPTISGGIAPKRRITPADGSAHLGANEGSGGGGNRPPRSNIKTVNSFKPDPCVSGG